MNYRHTHVSVHDGSPAMLVHQDGETITLVNEDGFQWTDPSDQWRPVTDESDPTLNYEGGGFDGRYDRP